MEVQCKRILRKHLQPARPLRRCIHGNNEPERIADMCAQAHVEVEDPERNVDVELFDKLVDPQKEKEEHRSIAEARPSLVINISYRENILYKRVFTQSGELPFVPEEARKLARSPSHLNQGATMWAALLEMRLNQTREEMEPKHDRVWILLQFKHIAKDSDTICIFPVSS